jgi:hypothetical protein
LKTGRLSKEVQRDVSFIIGNGADLEDGQELKNEVLEKLQYPAVSPFHKSAAGGAGRRNLHLLSHDPRGTSSWKWF